MPNRIGLFDDHGSWVESLQVHKYHEERITIPVMDLEWTVRLLRLLCISRFVCVDWLVEVV